MPARQLNADDAWRHRDDAADGQLVPDSCDEGLEDAVVGQRRPGADTDGQPVPALPGALGEEPADAELVRDRGENCGVGQQVHGVPELVR